MTDDEWIIGFLSVYDKIGCLKNKIVDLIYFEVKGLFETMITSWLIIQRLGSFVIEENLRSFFENEGAFIKNEINHFERRIAL